MKKHPPFPTICERCDRKIDDDTGWGVLIWYAAQPQPSAKAEGPRSNSLPVCGYCLHAMAKWLVAGDA
jgi:hypothetical protein